jgi:hypothetical protein
MSCPVDPPGICIVSRRRSGLGVKPFAQLLAGLEKGNVFFRDLHACAGTRIAADTGITPFHRKGAETAQFYSITARKRGGNFIENGGDDSLDIALIEVRVDLSETLDEL